MDDIMNRKGLNDIYETTMCFGAYCCGDIDGALDAARDSALAVVDDLAAGRIEIDEARSKIAAL